jgi:hypothetical protein
MSQNTALTDEKYDFTELDQAIKRMAIMSQWENDLENYGKTWSASIEEVNDGTGDAILTFPDELLMLKGWSEGTVLNMEVEQTPTGNVLIITEKK